MVGIELIDRRGGVMPSSVLTQLDVRSANPVYFNIVVLPCNAISERQGLLKLQICIWIEL